MSWQTTNCFFSWAIFCLPCSKLFSTANLLVCHFDKLKQFDSYITDKSSTREIPIKECSVVFLALFFPLCRGWICSLLTWQRALVLLLVLGWDVVDLRYLVAPQWALALNSSDKPDLPEGSMCIRNKEADTQGIKHIYCTFLGQQDTVIQINLNKTVFLLSLSGKFCYCLIFSEKEGNKCLILGHCYFR